MTIVLVACDRNEQVEQTRRVDGLADAGMIRRRVIEHTFSGWMGTATYTEFYAPDGTVHGPGYRAAWTIEHDRLCLDYDEAPQADCYTVWLDGDAVEWRIDGELRGTGTLVKGNPQNL